MAAASKPSHLGAHRAGNQQRSAGDTDEVIRLPARGHPARHAQPDTTERCLDPAVAIHEIEHAGRSDRCAAFVIVSVVEDHHRVSAEFEHVAARPEDLLDQPLEDRVEHVVDVLGTTPAHACEPLGEAS